MTFAPWATFSDQSRGRMLPEEQDPIRPVFQRDRDRVLHCKAFRRLKQKTQVFLSPEGDLYRTRLTHTLEVSQIARTIARALRLNEDLTEAIALAHDLGHTPFGHAGQDALNDCMAAHGGFEHNLQSLRVVDWLEHRYPDHDGLNLSFETREGILKHCSPANARLLDAAEPGGVARRFIDGTQPSLEAQLANLADAIAYNAHDIDDGVRSGLLTLQQVAEVPLFARFVADTQRDHPGLPDRRVLYESIRRMLSAQVYDVIDTTGAAIAAAVPPDADAARRAGPLVAFSAAMRAESNALKRFLFANLYRHPQVTDTTSQAQQVVRELFAAYLDRPAELRPSFAQRPDRERAVADYIAGMTDRFALREHERLTGQKLLT